MAGRLVLIFGEIQRFIFLPNSQRNTFGVREGGGGAVLLTRI